MVTLSPGASIAQVAEIIHAAVLLGPAAWGRESMPPAHLEAGIESKLTSQLIDLFHLFEERKLSYLLVGGMATLTYVEGRNTKDIDLIISAESLKLMPEIVVLEKRRKYAHAHARFADLAVDLLFTSDPLFDLLAKDYRTTHSFREIDVSLATLEGMILAKLYALSSFKELGKASRIFQIEADITMLYAINRPNLEAIVQTIDRYVRTGQQWELGMFIDEMLRRVARFDRLKMTNL